MSRSIPSDQSIRPIFAAIRTVPIAAKSTTEKTRAPVAAPFITISREPGTEASSLAQALVEALNAEESGEQKWSCWDRALVEKVAADPRASSELFDCVEDVDHSWMRDFLSSLSFTDDESHADEAKTYSRVAATIRAVAQRGRAVIVGRGGVFITRRMPGGIHILLVAPFEKRVACVARKLNISSESAATYIRQMERNRQAFYRRYWSAESLNPEEFTMCLNAAELDTPTMVEMIRMLVRRRASLPQ